MSKTLHVANLHSVATSSELHALCSQFGTVLNAQIMTDLKTGISLGFAQVEMADGADAAIAVLNQRPFQGRLLTVREAKLMNEGRRTSFSTRPRKS